jgi:hypothetical protein
MVIAVRRMPIPDIEDANKSSVGRQKTYILK